MKMYFWMVETQVAQVRCYRLVQSMPQKSQVRTLNLKTFGVFLFEIGQVLGNKIRPSRFSKPGRCWVSFNTEFQVSFAETPMQKPGRTLRRLSE